MKFTYKTKAFDVNGVTEDDYIFNFIKRTSNFYELDLLEYMFLMIDRSKKNTLAIDVGANIGNHSLFIKSFLADYLIAIEPNPDVLPVLQSNLRNNINDFTIYKCAVGENEGTGEMTMPENADNNIGMAKVVCDDSSSGAVKISTIDTLVDEWKGTYNNYDCNISLIKIDVEGMELSVLKGAQKTIEKHRPHIFAEAATLDEYHKLNNHLEKMGYKKLSIWAATPVYHFAYKPSFIQISKARFAEFSRSASSIKKKIVRRLNLYTTINK